MKNFFYVLTPDADEIAQQMALQYKPELFASLVDAHQRLAHHIHILTSPVHPDAYYDVYLMTVIGGMREGLRKFLSHHFEELFLQSSTKIISSSFFSKRSTQNDPLDEIIQRFLKSSLYSSSFQYDLVRYVESVQRIATPKEAATFMGDYKIINLFSLAHPSLHNLLSYTQQYLQMYHHNLEMLSVVYDLHENDEKTIQVIEEKAQGLAKILEVYEKEQWTLQSMIPPLPREKNKAYFLTLGVHQYVNLVAQSLLARAPDALDALLEPLNPDRFERFIVYRAADAFLELTKYIARKKQQSLSSEEVYNACMNFLYVLNDTVSQKNLYVEKNLHVFKSFWPFLSLSFPENQ